jgi:hypothetical protein
MPNNFSNLKMYFRIQIKYAAIKLAHKNKLKTETFNRGCHL